MPARSYPKVAPSYDQPAMCISLQWPPDLSQSGVLPWPILVARVFPVLEWLQLRLVPQWAPVPDFEVSSDASGALGYGAVFHGHWFSGAWLPTQVSVQGTFPYHHGSLPLESRWASKQVNLLSDNHSVVDILWSGTSKAPTIMSLVRYLSLLAACHSFSLTASPVRGSPIWSLTPCLVSVSAFLLASPSCRLHSHPDSTVAPLRVGTSLSDKCHFYLTQGLAPSTRKVYGSAQCHFLDFCAKDNSLSPSGSALPASEDALIHFCCHLADTLHHSSIKVYLSAVQSLHIEEGLPSPLFS